MLTKKLQKKNIPLLLKYTKVYDNKNQNIFKTKKKKNSVLDWENMESQRFYDFIIVIFYMPEQNINYV